MKKGHVVCSIVVIMLSTLCGCTTTEKNNSESQIKDGSYIEADVNGITTAYFNGEILEITEDYIYVKPIEEWQWQEVSKVKLPLKGWKEFDSSRWQCGDIVRVPFNSDSMEWGEDEVILNVIFQIYDWTEHGETKEASEEENLLSLLKSNYDKQIPSSATSPYVLQADVLSGMIVFGEGETTLIYVTQDGGMTWEETKIPEAGNHHHAKVTCATAISETAYCVGYRYWGEYDGTSFYLTTDCGNTWTRLSPEVEIPEEVTSNMRYAEAKNVSYADDRLQVQVSCKTITGSPWSIEVKLESADIGKNWSVVETWEQETDAEVD